MTQLKFDILVKLLAKVFGYIYIYITYLIDDT